MLGIVLAAGAGRRMGGPKARLLLRGEPLVAAHVRQLARAGCSDVLAVVRPGDELLAPRTVVSRAPDPAGSLRVALARVPLDAGLVIVTPVDVLPARIETLRALVAAVTANVLAATPVFCGQSGHPIVIARPALEALTPGRCLRDVLRDLGDRRVRVPVDDGAVATDLDEPADVGGAPTFLR